MACIYQRGRKFLATQDQNWAAYPICYQPSAQGPRIVLVSFIKLRTLVSCLILDLVVGFSVFCSFSIWPPATIVRKIRVKASKVSRAKRRGRSCHHAFPSLYFVTRITIIIVTMHVNEPTSPTARLTLPQHLMHPVRPVQRSRIAIDGADHLHAQRQPAGTGSVRHGDAGDPEQRPVPVEQGTAGRI